MRALAAAAVLICACASPDARTASPPPTAPLGTQAPSLVAATLTTPTTIPTPIPTASPAPVACVILPIDQCATAQLARVTTRQGDQVILLGFRVASGTPVSAPGPGRTSTKARINPSTSAFCGFTLGTSVQDERNVRVGYSFYGDFKFENLNDAVVQEGTVLGTIGKTGIPTLADYNLVVLIQRVEAQKFVAAMDLIARFFPAAAAQPPRDVEYPDSRPDCPSAPGSVLVRICREPCVAGAPGIAGITMTLGTGATAETKTTDTTGSITFEGISPFRVPNLSVGCSPVPCTVPTGPLAGAPGCSRGLPPIEPGERVTMSIGTACR